MKTLEAVDEIKKTFPLAVMQEVHFMGQTSLEVNKEFLKPILQLLKRPQGFEVLMDLTGVDYLEPVKQTKVIYFLHNPSNLERLQLFCWVNREEPLPSVTDLFAGADWYERELWDLFGVLFEGHPNLTRILLPDDWVGHPLRRDTPLGEEAVQFKFGVKPKIPSEIIPHVKSIG